MSWDQLRKEARGIEFELEEKLFSYNKQSSGPSRTLEFQEREIEELHTRLGDVIGKLTKLLEAQYPSQSGTSNPSMMHMLQRHRDMLYDSQKEFKTLKASIRSARERSELIGSVREDINQYNNTEILERKRVENVTSIADNVIETAYQAKASLLNQRNTLFSSSRRMNQLAQRFPLINNLISAIQTRKKRDTLILLCVITICLFFLFIYMLR